MTQERIYKMSVTNLHRLIGDGLLEGSDWKVDPIMDTFDPTSATIHCRFTAENKTGLDRAFNRKVEVEKIMPHTIKRVG